MNGCKTGLCETGWLGFETNIWTLDPSESISNSKPTNTWLMSELKPIFNIYMLNVGLRRNQYRLTYMQKCLQNSAQISKYKHC